MDVIVWLLAGAVVTWVATSFLKWNAARGLIVCAIIGLVGAFFGGNVLAPIFGGGPNEAGGFHPFGVVIAALTAIACLKIADVLYERFDF